MGLVVVIGVQLFLYTMLFDIHFFLRNVAVIGGLLVLISAEDSNMKDRSVGGLVPSLQNVKVNQQMEVFTLVGRAAIGFILLSMIFKEREYIHWSIEYPAL